MTAQFGLNRPQMDKGGIQGLRQPQAGFSLLFARSRRPSADDIARALAAVPQVSGAQVVVSHRPDPAEGWVELLASGLTFDLSGLKPAAAVPAPATVQHLGLEAAPMANFVAVSLMPGPHLAGGDALMPVVRIMAATVAALARELSAAAVHWRPAGTAMAPAYFAQIVGAWLDGGVFPALGLTALERRDDGTVFSTGLGYFTGQELRVEAAGAEAAADTVKLAVRMIDHLVAAGPLAVAEAVDLPSGERLLIEPTRDGRTVVVRRGG